MSGSKLSDVFPPSAVLDPQTPAHAAVADQPLGLTVHAMPLQGADTGVAGASLVNGRLKMLAILLVCVAPVVASYFTYYVIRPEGRRNFGELIDPQPPMPNAATVSLNGEPGTLRDLTGQWLLVSVGSATCDAACTRHLYLQRQLRESLGKEKDRVDWVWLVDDDAPVDAQLRDGLQQARVLRVKHDDLAGWLAPAAGHALADHLYLVDPKGMWMMRFPPGLEAATAAKAKSDLERLLRASVSWDKAGRESRP